MVQAYKMMKKWRFNILSIRLNQEAALRAEFDNFCSRNRIRQEKTPTNIKEPKGAAERSGY